MALETLQGDQGGSDQHLVTSRLSRQRGQQTDTQQQVLHVTASSWALEFNTYMYTYMYVAYYMYMYMWLLVLTLYSSRVSGETLGFIQRGDPGFYTEGRPWVLYRGEALSFVQRGGPGFYTEGRPWVLYRGEALGFIQKGGPGFYTEGRPWVLYRGDRSGGPGFCAGRGGECSMTSAAC